MVLANYPSVRSDFFHANLICYVLYFQLLKDCWQLVGTFFEQLELQYIWKGSRGKNRIFATENSPIWKGTCQNCHCNRCVTVTGVTVSGEVCTVKSGSFNFFLIPFVHGDLVKIIGFSVLLMYCQPLVLFFCVEDCGVGTYTNESGRLTSPSYPDYYPPDMDCEYTISVVSELHKGMFYVL